MNTYTVYFRNDQQYGCRNLDADTPQQALELARCVATENREDLNFTDYEGRHDYINEIEVFDSEDNSVAVWHDDQLRLCLAAPALLAAAQKVLARWEQGDLAEAVRNLSAVVAEAKGGDA
jgi:hypothetical protein